MGEEVCVCVCVGGAAHGRCREGVRISVCVCVCVVSKTASTLTRLFTAYMWTVCVCVCARATVRAMLMLAQSLPQGPVVITPACVGTPGHRHQLPRPLAGARGGARGPSSPGPSEPPQTSGHTVVHSGCALRQPFA